MAKKDKTQEKGRVKLPFGRTEFVLNNLDDAQVEELNSYEATPPDLWAFLSDCVDKGIDVKITHDTYSGGYQCVAAGNWEGYPSAGFACSGYSKHGSDDALFVLWYKVAVVCTFDLSSARGREKRTKERG